MRNRTLWFLVFIATTTIFAADAPFFGTWKQNNDKTDFTAVKIKFEQTANGEIKETDQGGISTTFKLDGKDYPTPTGATVAWRQLDAKKWETITKVKGKVIETDTATLSPDGKTITILANMAAAEGKASEGSITLQRVSGGPGLIGEWKGTQTVKMSEDQYFELASRGTDGVIITFSPPGMTCETNMDGRDYPCSGNTVPSGTTISFKKTGPNSFQIVQKKDGTLVMTTDGTVSSDGKTLTSSMRFGNAPLSDAVKFVFDRVASRPKS